MRVVLVSSDDQLRRLCKEAVAGASEGDWDFASVPPDREPPPADLYVWDFDPNLTSFRALNPESGLRSVFLVGRRQLEVFCERLSGTAAGILLKPIDQAALRRLVVQTIAHCQVAVPNGGHPDREPTGSSNGGRPVFSGGAAMRRIQQLLSQVAASDVPLLFQGESGVGKEVFARHVHAQSTRVHKPFLKLNCAALPSELVESELFGYDRGAFTGAFQRKPGMFEVADGGTIMLDEIGDMDFKLQAKLLQVLQDQEFQRLGGKETIKVDVRVIAATHRDLERAIQENQFREDLYYRLNVINLRMPPLRERKEDILPLAEFLLKKHLPAKSALPVITPALRHALVGHSWPGNIRELENVMRKFLVLRDPESLARELRNKLARKQTMNALQFVDSAAPEAAQASQTILEQVTHAKQTAERTAILAALDSTHWNRKKAATLLKIDYKALLYKMKKLGIEDKMVSFQADSGAPVPTSV